MSRIAQRTYWQTLWAAPLLALLVIAIFLEGFPVVHAHLDGEPGFYNAACSLSLLAAPTGGAPLPTLDLPGSRLPELPAPIQSVPPTPQNPFVLGFASRAPPLA